MEERKRLIQWIKGHKKQLILAGISIGSLILIILGIRNREALISVWTSLQEVKKHSGGKTEKELANVVANIPATPAPKSMAVLAPNSETVPFEVSRHIRNLPSGWQASPEKIAEAYKYNIVLMDGQTWVDSYRKGGVAA